MSDRGRDRAIQLIVVESSVDFAKYITVISTRTKNRETQFKQDNCNRHLQLLERRHLSNRGRDRAVQLVVVELPVDFKKHTLLLSAHEKRTERHSSKVTIIIVTDKLVSTVNCPIDVGIVPLSSLKLRYLLISQSTHCCHQHTSTNIVKANNERIVIVTDNCWSAVNCPIKIGIVPISSLVLRYLLISQSTHCYYQHRETTQKTRPF